MLETHAVLLITDTPLCWASASKTHKLRSEVWIQNKLCCVSNYIHQFHKMIISFHQISSESCCQKPLISFLWLCLSRRAKFRWSSFITVVAEQPSFQYTPIIFWAVPSLVLSLESRSNKKQSEGHPGDLEIKSKSMRRALRWNRGEIINNVTRILIYNEVCPFSCHHSKRGRAHRNQYNCINSSSRRRSTENSKKLLTVPKKIIDDISFKKAPVLYTWISQNHIKRWWPSVQNF